MSGDLRYCPGCGTDQRGEKIPAKYADCYSLGTTHYWRTVMVEIPGVYDGGLFYRCPDCGRAWHRWPETHPLHAKAVPYVVEANRA